MSVPLLKYIQDAAQLYQRLLRPAREAAGLTQGELDILLFLANNPEYDTASDVVAIRRLAKSNVSVGVRSLERKGFLTRQADVQDRRLEHLRLTPAADAAVTAGRNGQAEFEAVLIAGLTPEERETLSDFTVRIQRNITRALDRGSEKEQSKP